MKALDIPFSFKKLGSRVKENLSLEEFSLFLSSWKIPNEAVLVEKEMFIEFPCPTILYLEDEGIFVILNSIDAKTVEIIHPSEGIVKYSLNEIKQLWNGKCIILEKEDQSGDPELEIALKEEEIDKQEFIQNLKIIDNFIDENACKKILDSLQDP